MENHYKRKDLSKYVCINCVILFIGMLYPLVNSFFFNKLTDDTFCILTDMKMIYSLVSAISAVAIVLGVSISTCICTYKKNKVETEYIKTYLGNGIGIMLLIVILNMIIIGLNIEGILKGLGVSNSGLNFMKFYMNAFILFLPFSAISNVSMTILMIERKVKFSLIGMIIAIIINIALNLLFAILGFGIYGVVFATSIAKVLNALIMGGYLIAELDCQYIKWRHVKLRWHVIKDILNNSYVILIMQFGFVITYMYMSYVAKKYMENEYLIIMNMVTGLVDICMIPAYATEFVVIPLMRQSAINNNYKEAKKICIDSIMVLTIVLLIEDILLIVFANILSNTFTSNIELRYIISSNLMISTCMLPILGVTIIIPIYFRCIGHIKFAVVISMIRQIMILMPFIYCGATQQPIEYIFDIRPIIDIVSVIFMCSVLGLEFRKSNYKISKKDIVLNELLIKVNQ